MPSFKPKAQKKILINNKSVVTLDNKHTHFISKFDKNENETLPKLKKERVKYKNLLKKKNLDIQDELDYKDCIIEINKQIKLTKQEKKDYYLNNSKYIFDYFENKQLISKGNNKIKILKEYFNIKNNDNVLKVNNNTNVQKYLTSIDESFLNIDDFITATDVCNYCKQGELIPVMNEGIMICNVCYKSIKFLVENEKPSYKEPPKEVCFYAYKRINHFREILAQFQAKETTQIPCIVIDNITLQMKKERITLEQLTNSKAKEILKKLGFNKYYEHIPFIKDKLGIKPPIMSAELEDTLCNLFIDIQGPYAKFCPDVRVNFLNYYYTIYKLCELLDQQEFLPIFPMLKDREKRIEQDEIWKKICEELNWEFIPTV
jgi:hypothetical protein